MKPKIQFSFNNTKLKVVNTNIERYVDEIHPSSLDNRPYACVDPGVKSLVVVGKDLHGSCKRVCISEDQRISRIRGSLAASSYSKYQKRDGVKDFIASYKSQIGYKSNDPLQYTKYLRWKQLFKTRIATHFSRKIHANRKYSKFVKGQIYYSTVAKRLKEIYGTNVVLLFGDYTRGMYKQKNNQRHFKEKMRQNGILVLLISEYNTSKKCSSTVIEDNVEVACLGTMAFAYYKSEKGTVNSRKNTNLIPNLSSTGIFSHYYIIKAC